MAPAWQKYTKCPGHPNRPRALDSGVCASMTLATLHPRSSVAEMRSSSTSQMTDAVGGYDQKRTLPPLSASVRRCACYAEALRYAQTCNLCARNPSGTRSLKSPSVSSHADLIVRIHGRRFTLGCVMHANGRVFCAYGVGRGDAHHGGTRCTPGTQRGGKWCGKPEVCLHLRDAINVDL